MAKPSVWVVDDLPSKLAAFERAHSNHFDVSSFRSPIEVLQELKNGRKRPDALLCDIYFFQGSEAKKTEKKVMNQVKAIRKIGNRLHAEDHQDGIDLMEEIQREFGGRAPFPIFAHSSKGPYLMDNSGFGRVSQSGARWLFKGKSTATAEYAIITNAIKEITKSTRKVFLVQRNDGVRTQVREFLQNLGLQVIVWLSEPDRGKAIVEKFEPHADAAFAVILVTADDWGAIKSSLGREERAGQNVIFEWGFFLGSLGRERVCILCERGVTIPSDGDGIVYKDLSDTKQWQQGLKVDLKRAGLILKETA